MAELHAAVLIVVPVATVVLTVALCKRRPSAKRLMGAILALPVLGLVSIDTLVHKCNRGNPDHHIIVMFVAVAGLLILVTDLRRAVSLAIVLGVVPYVFGLGYHNLVHGDRYVGFAGQDPLSEYVREETAASLMDEGRENTAHHEGSWLSDAAFFRKEKGSGLRESRCLAGAGLWHSPITLLYRQCSMDLWYPGGKQSEAAPRIEWRERP
jgi:hypothetical protein